MVGKKKVGNGVSHGGRTTTGGKGFAYHKDGNTRGVGCRAARKVFKDAIHGISKGDVRRLARRGGVKRISAPIYHEMRRAMKDHLTTILRDCTIFLENSLDARKTITVDDVIFALKRRGRPVYGFGNGYSHARPDTKVCIKKHKAAAAN